MTKLLSPVSRPLWLVGCLVGLATTADAQTVAVDVAVRYQTIDGFGTFAGPESSNAWWQELFLDDLGASIMRLDLTPPFVSPTSAQHYCSPWFGQTTPLSLDNNGNGPDGTRTRRYTSAADYSNAFGGCSAPIAVMGDDIDANAALLDLGQGGPEAAPPPAPRSAAPGGQSHPVDYPKSAWPTLSMGCGRHRNCPMALHTRPPRTPPSLSLTEQEHTMRPLSWASTRGHTPTWWTS